MIPFVPPLGFRGGLTFPFNLTLTNGDFELGTSANWTSWGNNTAVMTVGGALGTTPHSGSNCARWGASAFAAFQNTTGVIPAQYQPEVDAGKVEYTVSFWHAGFSPSDSDTGTSGVEFLDGSGNVIGGVWDTDEHDLNVNGWTQYTLTRWLPAGTRTIRVESRAQRVTGTNLDWYADDITHQLLAKTPGKKHVLIINEIGTSVANWTNVTGTLTAYALSAWNLPALGWGASSTAHSYTEGNIPAAAYASVDAGTTRVQATSLHDKQAANHKGRFYLEFYDVSNVIIGARVYSDAAEFIGSGIFTGRQLTQAIPALTRKIRYGLVATRSGASGNLRWDTTWINVGVEYVY
jgi:hypothetical protein